MLLHPGATGIEPGDFHFVNREFRQLQLTHESGFRAIDRCQLYTDVTDPDLDFNFRIVDINGEGVGSCDVDLRAFEFQGVD